MGTYKVGAAAAFQSTRPIRGATICDRCGRVIFPHFNPRAPYGARLAHGVGCDILDAISIHAPHTGRDRMGRGAGAVSPYFNPRAPYGARRVAASMTVWLSTFQSTRPVRGATRCTSGGIHTIFHFNPRAPYGARLCMPSRQSPLTNFNPRAPYGARRFADHVGQDGQRFQSTRPVRGATVGGHPGGHHCLISIHAPRTGRDNSLDAACSAVFGISIHAPRTGRDQIYPALIMTLVTFQSTRPVRGATQGQCES